MLREKAIIVVLGGGTTLGASEYPDGETLGTASLLRSRYGVQLARTTGLPIMVSSGRAAGARRSEAILMRDFIEKELKHPVTFVEEQSANTRESAFYTSAILGRAGIRSVLLVTDVLHMSRAKFSFESVGLHIMPAPMNFQSNAQWSLTDFLPSVLGMHLCHAVLYEALGQIWYRLRGIMPD